MSGGTFADSLIGTEEDLWRRVRMLKADLPPTILLIVSPDHVPHTLTIDTASVLQYGYAFSLLSLNELRLMTVDETSGLFLDRYQFHRGNTVLDVSAWGKCVSVLSAGSLQPQMHQHEC